MLQILPLTLIRTGRSDLFSDQNLDYGDVR